MGDLEKIRRSVKPWKNHFINFRRRDNFRLEKLSIWQKKLCRKRARREVFCDDLGEFISGGRNVFYRLSRHLVV